MLDPTEITVYRHFCALDTIIYYDAMFRRLLRMYLDILADLDTADPPN